MSAGLANPTYVLNAARNADHPAERLKISVTAPSELVTLCALAGEVDHYTVEVFRRRLIGSLGTAAPLVVVDLSKVRFFGVAGLQVLIDARSMLEETGRRLRLVTGQPCVDRLLQLAGDRARFEVMASLADAVLVAA
ncbi:STAS domain-containing protein [Streptomyces gardneri]|uniref:STAS domain-containing protein n=1 Tax=Nocardia TaxID=1817 RepID=UPI00135A2363|nr:MULTISPECIES: STAS domain-containing protein [Nocardia]MBF6164705.1 STAS domain-containing protein [Streptomyces gardneri]MBF6209026.1 STAS domain-containing protein [Streptomyces gardneri]